MQQTVVQVNFQPLRSQKLKKIVTYLGEYQLNMLLPNAWLGSALSLCITITLVSKKAFFISMGMLQSAAEVV